MKITMKRLLLLTTYIFCFFQVFAQLGYWYQNEFIEMKPSGSSYIFIRPMQSRNSSDKSLFLSELLKKDVHIVTSIESEGYIVSTGQPLSDEGVYTSEIYGCNDNYGIIVLPQIAIRLKPGFVISSFLDDNNNLINLDYSNRGVYIYNSNLKNSALILNYIKELNNEPYIEWAEPVFLGGVKSCNTYYSWQFYLKNNTGSDINVEPAWNIIEGSSNIKIAVIDQGVDFDHVDMSNSVLSGYTVDNTSGLGLPQNPNDLNKKAHGIACAGIICAENNAIGIKGVAYGSKIIPVNIVPYYAYQYIDGDGELRTEQGFANSADIAQAIIWAYQRADIISCSWSSPPSQFITDAINDARNFGRDGKGCIVVASSGNDYPKDSTDVSFPAILDNVIAVGAIDRNDSILEYSQRGGHLNIVAFSANRCGNEPPDFITTDRMGSLGYINDNYYYNFSGTSAACPQVAGVAALMLSANPNLTESQVRANLYKTCKKLSGYNYNASGWNNQVGYGLVDAEAAVLSSLRIMGSVIPCGSTSYYVDLLPNTYSVSWSWKSACSVPITQNTPTTNHCTITKNDYQYLKNTLVATISKNGNTITTVEKVLDTGANFSGTYQQAAAPLMNIPAIGPKTFHNGQTIMLMLGSKITLKSPKFVGANISYSGYTPFYWSHNDSTIIIRHFAFPYNNPKDLIITGTYSGNCEAFQFILQLSEPASVFPHASINIIPVGLGYAFELCANMMSDDSPETYSSIKLSGWHMTIANALTGKIMLDEDIEGTQKIVSTTNWEVGIYVINARVGDNIITRKFQISKD